MKVTGTIYDGDSEVDYSTYVFLYNKKAIRYPEYTDSKSGKTITVPTSSNMPKVATSERVSWTTTDRNNYRTWYEKQYNSGTSMVWTDIEIHHIKPRAYGGTNAHSNLIPLPKSTHTTVTTWWASY